MSGTTNFARLVASLVRGHAVTVVLAFGAILVSAVAEGLGFTLVVPLVATILDGGEGSAKLGLLGDQFRALGELLPPERRLAGILGLIVIVFMFKAVALTAATGLTRWFINSLRAEWVTKAFSAHVNAPYAETVAQPQGAIIHDIIVESDSASKGVLLSIEAVARIVQIAVLVGVLFLADWQVTAAIILVAALGMTVFWRASGNYSLGAGGSRRALRQEVADLVAESIQALRTVKLLGLAEARSKAINKRLRVYRSVDTRFEVISGLPMNTMDFAAVSLGSLIILVLTLGLAKPLQEVLPLLLLFGLVFARVTSAAGFIFAKRMMLVASIPSMRAVLREMERPAEAGLTGARMERIAGEIRFENIHLTPPGRAPVFLGLNLVIPPTGLTAIVGPSGVGKTTLVDLLVRLREPDQGRITVNGVDIRDYDVRSIRARVGYVTQDPQFFNGSLHDNFLLARPGASTSDMESALAQARALEFVRAMPDGLATELGRGAVALSGGQRQRLALARELLRDPDLFIFDEPTSALDREAEAGIGELIEQLAQSHPVILIAHRLHSVQKARAIYRLDSGLASPATFLDLAEDGPLVKAAVSA